MKRALLSLLCLVVGSGSMPSRAGPGQGPEPPPRPTVQIAILLDTSNSMDGLIAQAKTQLWNVVNEFVRARKNGRPPAIQVALFEYGKSSLAATGRLRAADPAAHRRPRPRLRRAVRPQDQRRRGVLRLGDPRCRQPAGVERRRAMCTRPSSSPGMSRSRRGRSISAMSCKTAIERGILVNTIFCGAERGGASDRLERRGASCRRPLYEHRPEPEGRRDPGPAGRRDRSGSACN